MSERLFDGKVTLTAGSSLISAKVDVIKHSSGIEIRLIDTSNIFTLFVCAITQSDFYILKREQDILVDYERFIQVLVGLFHSLSKNRLSGVFNEGVLRFVENSEFRNICKLEIRFAKPEEAQYKRYLADLLSRLESDNVKLISENAMLRDKCINGDRDMRERMRGLESELAESRRRLDLQARDYGEMEAKWLGREEELGRLSSRVYELENENGRQKYELEKYQSDNSQSFREQLKAREQELEGSMKEIKVANEIIKKLREENAQMKEERLKELGAVQKEAERREELGEKVVTLQKRNKVLEEKYRAAKDEAKEKAVRISELEMKSKELTKQLACAQNVYSHFYAKNVEDQPDKDSDTFSLKPETLPHR